MAVAELFPCELASNGVTITFFPLILLFPDLRVVPSFEMLPKMLLWTFMCVCVSLPAFACLAPFSPLLISPLEHSLTLLAHETSSLGTRPKIDLDGFGHAGVSNVGRLERHQLFPLWMSKWGSHECPQLHRPPSKHRIP